MATIIKCDWCGERITLRDDHKKYTWCMERETDTDKTYRFARAHYDFHRACSSAATKAIRNCFKKIGIND